MGYCQIPAAQSLSVHIVASACVLRAESLSPRLENILFFHLFLFYRIGWNYYAKGYVVWFVRYERNWGLTDFWELSVGS
jgi:hypothetical protein